MVVVRMTGIETDARIVLAEGITKFFTDIVINKKIPLTINRQKILSRLADINSKIMALKWSYIAHDQLTHSKGLREIEIYAKEIFDSFPEKWEERLLTRGLEGKKEIATLVFIRDFFYTMRERLTKGYSDDLTEAIDYYAGEIISIESIDKKNSKCVVTDGHGRYNVVTNIVGLKKGDLLPIAKLLPRVVHGVFSEGMFMGSGEGLGLTKDDIGKRPNLTDKELGQARGILEQTFLSKK